MRTCFKKYLNTYIFKQANITDSLLDIFHYQVSIICIEIIYSTSVAVQWFENPNLNPRGGMYNPKVRYMGKFRLNQILTRT